MRVLEQKDGPLSDSETEARRLSVLASCARLAAEAGTP
jgi:hypothetical protein